MSARPTVEDDVERVVVSAFNGMVSISGKRDEDVVNVYTTSGVLVKSTVGASFELPVDNVYVVRVGNRSYKVAL